MPIAKLSARFQIRDRVLCAGIVFLVLLGASSCGGIRRVWNYSRLLEEDRLVENFRNMDGLFDTRNVARGGSVSEFEQQPRTLPETFVYQGEERSFSEWLERRRTTGLLVIHEGRIVSQQH